MSLETLRPSPAFKDVLPVEYKDLVEHGPYNNRKGDGSKQTMKVTDMGMFKEVIVQLTPQLGCERMGGVSL